MTPILAQAPINVHSDTSTGIWLILLTGVISAVGLQINNWRKTKLEQEDRSKDLQLNVEIRDAMRQVEIASTKQNGTLEKVIEVDKLHHTELMSALERTCNYQAKQTRKLPTC